MKVLLVAYNLNPQANPVVQGRSGINYARGVHNPSLRRFEAWMDLEDLKKAHLDIFNNLRRRSAQWILADIDLGAEAGELALSLQSELDKCRAAIGLLKPRADRCALLEATLADLNAQAAANAELKTGELVPRSDLESAQLAIAVQNAELLELRAALAVAGHLAIEATAGTEPSGPPPAFTGPPLTVASNEPSPNPIARAKELEPKGYRDLRKLALDQEIKLPANVSKEELIRLILAREFPEEEEQTQGQT